jgi:AcrR family transcriptional regulator
MARATSHSGKAANARGTRLRFSVDDRRAQLLALGLAEFSTRRYEDVSVEGIAAQAGISRGLLFHYFASKRDFYVATVEMMAARMLAETVPEQVQGDLPTTLLNGLRRYFAFVEQHADMFVTLLEAGSDHAARPVVEATRRAYVERIRAFMPPASGRDEALLRTALNGWERLVEGLALDWLANRSVALEDVVQIALRGALIVPGALETLLPPATEPAPAVKADKAAKAAKATKKEPAVNVSRQSAARARDQQAPARNARAGR